MAADIACASIYSLVKQIKDRAERLDTLKEDARKLHRYVKRVEAVISDLQPYYSQAVKEAQAQQLAQLLNGAHDAEEESVLRSPPASPLNMPKPDAFNPVTPDTILSGLHSVAAVLAESLELIEQAGCRGPLSTFLQSELLQQEFLQAMHDLDAAVTLLPCTPHLLGSAYAETKTQIQGLRQYLQHAKFELLELHAHQVAAFKDACDGVMPLYGQLQSSCNQILQEVYGHAKLSKGELAISIADLREELRQLQLKQLSSNSRACVSISSPPAAAADAGAAAETADKQAGAQKRQHKPHLYLNMMTDLLHANHVRQNAVPVEFTCALTAAMMVEPVIIHESGHTYERTAIEAWYNSGKLMCPKSGIRLTKGLNISPNHALKAAIRTWNEMLQQQFVPLLRSCASAPGLTTPSPTPCVSRVNSTATDVTSGQGARVNSFMNNVANTLTRRVSMPAAVHVSSNQPPIAGAPVTPVSESAERGSVDLAAERSDVDVAAAEYSSPEGIAAASASVPAGGASSSGASVGAGSQLVRGSSGMPVSIGARDAPAEPAAAVITAIEIH